MRGSLAALAERACAAEAEGARLDPAVAAALDELWQFVSRRFGAGVLAEIMEAAAEQDDEAPVIVDT